MPANSQWKLRHNFCPANDGRKSAKEFGAIIAQSQTDALPSRLSKQHVNDQFICTIMQISFRTILSYCISGMHHSPIIHYVSFSYALFPFFLLVHDVVLLLRFARSAGKALQKWLGNKIKTFNKTISSTLTTYVNTYLFLECLKSTANTCQNRKPNYLKREFKFKYWPWHKIKLNKL